MIKRPLVWMLGAYLWGMFLGWNGFSLIIIITLCIFICILIYWLLYRSKLKLLTSKDSFIWCLPAFIILGFILMVDVMRPPPMDLAFEDKVVGRLNGEVTMNVARQNSNVLHLKDVTVELADNSIYRCDKVIIYYRESKEYLIGNKVTVYGTIQKFSKATNPGQFNEDLYNRIQKIDYKVMADEIEIIDSDYKPFYAFLARIKERFMKLYEDLLSERESGVITAILLGEKHLLEDEVKDLYQENGISHLLSISGLHISLIGMTVYNLLKKMKAGLHVSTFVCLAFIYSYGILTNFSVSTNRAFVMLSVSLLARIFGRSYDMLSTMSLSALIILLQNPLQIFSAGFLLSFGSVLGIALIMPSLKSIIQAENKIIDSVLISLSVQLMTLPLILYFFYQLPIYSILINLILVPLMSMLVISSLIAGIVGLIHLSFGVFLIGGANYILKFYEGVCGLGSRLPKNLITPGEPEILLIFLYYFLIVLFLFLVKKGAGRKALLLLAFAFFLLIIPKKKAGLTVTMLDVGQGDGIFMETESGTRFLIDGGSSDVSQVGTYRIQPYLLSQGVDRLDYAFVSHYDHDHINGLKELLEGSRIKINNLILPKLEGGVLDNKDKIELEELARKRSCNILYIGAGDLIREGDLYIRCLHPAEDYNIRTNNGYSVVLSLNYKDFDMLLTGDLEADGEELLLKMLEGKYDVLKVAHHGSKNSSGEEFLNLIKPRYSLISCGKNNRYGHPHVELLERLDDIGSEAIVTYESGAITIRTDGERMELEKYH